MGVTNQSGRLTTKRAREARRGANQGKGGNNGILVPVYRQVEKGRGRVVPMRVTDRQTDKMMRGTVETGVRGRHIERGGWVGSKDRSRQTDQELSGRGGVSESTDKPTKR